jgi:hypothetical protein
MAHHRRLYYQYNRSRLPVCTLPVHALLHLANDIRQAGPVWCYWAFAMERFCGMLARSGKSQRFLWASLSYRIHGTAQLNQIKIVYQLDKQLNIRGVSSATGQVYDECK